MKKLSTPAALLSPLALLLGACGWLGDGLESGDSAIAKINGAPVGEQLFAAHLQHKRLSPRNDEQRARMLDDYLKREALSQVIVNQPDFNAAAVQAELDDLRREIVISRYFEAYLNKQVSEQAVADYFANHADDYAEKKVRLAHVLIRLNRTMSEEERLAKLTLAREAQGKIRSGVDFAKVVEAYSEDKVSARKGGDLGWMSEGAISPRFSELAFSLEVGAVSEPFETPFGYHLLKVLEAPTVVRQPFEAVKGQIRHQLRSRAKTREMERLLGEIEIEKLEPAS